MSKELVKDLYTDPVSVLDQGAIAVVDVFGDEQRVIEAARMSNLPWLSVLLEKEERTPDQNVRLIRYLMKNDHGSPFEMCSITFAIRLPIYVARQLMRYRTAKVNEYSQRYRPAIGKFHRTKAGEWRSQAKSNKQASGAPLEGHTPYNKIKETREYSLDGGPSIQDYLRARENDVLAVVQEFYQELLDLGVAREQARKILPVSTYTDIMFQIDARNLMNLLKQRLDPHAQREIREYAEIMGSIFASWMPNIHSAFEDFLLYSATLSSVETESLAELLRLARAKGPAVIDQRATLLSLIESKSEGAYSRRSWQKLCDVLFGEDVELPGEGGNHGEK